MPRGYVATSTRMAVMLSLPPRSLASSMNRFTAASPPENDDHRDLVVAQVAVQTVGAEQEAVARSGAHEPGVDLDVVAVADRARDHVAVRRRLRLVRP